MGSGFSLTEILKHILNSPMALTIDLILVAMSLYSLTIALERWVYYRKMRSATLLFLPAVTKALKNADLDAALKETKNHRLSHLAKVLNGGLHEFINHESQKHEFDLISACSRALERSAAITSAELKRGLAVLATVGASAPFVGLLGTVFGVIASFQGMASAGSGGLGAISAGIAEALFATGLGLAVAIPAVWFYNYFTNKIEYFEVEMTNSASELLDFFLKRIGTGTAAGTSRH